MKRWTSTWTAMLVVGFLAVPGIGLAQTSPAAAPSATSSATAQDKSAQGTPQEHLQEADAALNSISPTAVSGKAKSQIADLKKHVNSLQKMTASTSADASANANATSAAKWSTEAAAADKIFGELLSATPATGDAAASVTAEPKPTGTSGTTAPKASAHANGALDDETKAKLTAARASLTAFAAAMSGTAPAAAATASPAAAIRCVACDGGAGRSFCFGTDGITHAIVAGTVTGVPGNASRATAGCHAGAAARNAVDAPGRAHAVDPAFSQHTSAAAGDAANRADEPGAASGEHHSATGGADRAGERQSGCGQAGVDSRTRLAGADDTVAGGTGADWRTARPGVTAHLELQRADHDEQRVEGLLRQGRCKPERAPRLAGA